MQYVHFILAFLAVLLSFKSLVRAFNAQNNEAFYGWFVAIIAQLGWITSI